MPPSPDSLDSPESPATSGRTTPPYLVVAAVAAVVAAVVSCVLTLVLVQVLDGEEEEDAAARTTATLCQKVALTRAALPSAAEPPNYGRYEQERTVVVYTAAIQTVSASLEQGASEAILGATNDLVGTWAELAAITDETAGASSYDGNQVKRGVALEKIAYRDFAAACGLSDPEA